MYLTLGTLEQNTDIEATLGYMIEDAQRRGAAAVESVSYVYRSAARRWVDNILNLLESTRETLVKDKAGQPFFARYPAAAQRILSALRTNVENEFKDLEKASSGPLTRALTTQNFFQTTLDIISLVFQKVGQIAVAAGSAVTTEVGKGAAKDPTLAIALALGGAVAVAYVWRSFR